MTATIDELNGTESLDELEAMLAEIEQSPDQPLEGTDSLQTDVDPAPSAGEEAAGSDHADPDQEAADTTQRVVMAKGGKHTIPYEVLEQARNEARQLREQLATAQQAQAERDKLAAVLEKNGIELDTSDPDSIDVAAIEELAQDYPDLGKPLAAIARKLQKLEQPAQPAIDPVQTALKAVPDLVAWRDGDQDRFDLALSIDDKLKVDPAWQNQPLEARFAEVARRTRLAFGDPVSKVAPAKGDFIPSSPTALGQTHHASAGVERFGAMSHHELTGEFGAMSDAQIEALLEQAGF